MSFSNYLACSLLSQNRDTTAFLRRGDSRIARFPEPWEAMENNTSDCGTVSTVRAQELQISVKKGDQLNSYVFYWIKQKIYPEHDCFRKGAHVLMPPLVMSIVSIGLSGETRLFRFVRLQNNKGPPPEETALVSATNNHFFGSCQNSICLIQQEDIPSVPGTKTI